MGKLTRRGVQKRVREAKPGLTNDGEDLYLMIGKKGEASWIYRFRRNGKLRDMGLGSYSDVSLAEARNRAGQNRSLVKDGLDPLEAKVEEKQAEETIPTFTSCAARYIKSHRRSWRNAKHARQWVSTLKTYTRPLIGTKPVKRVFTKNGRLTP
ncbi:MAG: Arm DNA-binding domain-containing protein [Arhodomonas sp.]|nr:Arm DNA-binding domain-containing protein [Arhodomonas sp.]